MDLLCVTNSDIAENLRLKGARLLRKTKDINGTYVWFFGTDNIPIDISDAFHRGEVFFSSTMSIAF